MLASLAREMLGAVDAALILGSGAFVFFQLSTISTKKIRRRYEDQRKHLLLAPPGWVYGVVWTILYALQVVVAYYVFTSTNPTWFTELLILFFIKTMLNKWWSVAFWDQNSPRLAFWVLLGIFGTSFTSVVMIGLNSTWLPFGCELPYCVWCTIALLWNCQLCTGEEEETEPAVLPMKSPVTAPTAVASGVRHGPRKSVRVVL